MQHLTSQTHTSHPGLELKRDFLPPVKDVQLSPGTMKPLEWLIHVNIGTA